MKEIAVYIQYPWKISDSQYYRSMIDNSPEGIRYISPSKDVGIISNKNKLKWANILKRTVRNILKKLGLIVINIRKTRTNRKYDLVHCAHCLSEGKKPWVADFESVWQMWISGRNKKNAQKKVLNILKGDNCKKIIAWTESSKKEIIEKFPEVKKKVEIVPYAMAAPKISQKREKNITLLFVGRYFYRKGGLHALESSDRLTHKYKNVNAIFVSDVPREIKDKYSKNKKIKFYNLLPHKEVLNKIYPKSDIFIYPGYSDTFGFSLIESLAFGIPSITVDGFARREIISDGKTGFIINRKDVNPHKISGYSEEETISSIVKKTSHIIENSKLRNKMSKNCIEIIKKGKFSIKNRNKKLKKIYVDALK